MLQRLESRFASNLTLKLLVGALLALLLALVALLVACSAPQALAPVPEQRPTSVQQSEQLPFKVLSLAVSPSNANKGQSVTISADIRNYSSDSGSYQAELRINDVVEATKDLTIPVGTIQRINFIVAKDKPGNYNVSFGGMNGEFAIAEQSNAVQANSPSTNGQTNAATASCCDPNQAKSSPSGGCCGTPSQSANSPSTNQPSSPITSQWGRNSGGCCGK